MDVISIVIVVLLVVHLILTFCMYQKVLNIFEFYKPEVPPPPTLRFVESFLKK